MRGLQRLIMPLMVYFSRRLWLFLAVYLLSFHQATILTYYDFAEQSVRTGLGRLPGVHIPNALILEYVRRLGLIKISAKTFGYAIPLFLAQSIPALIYSFADSIKSKRYAALTIWVLPALLAVPTLKLMAIYLMSPLFTIVTFPGFMFVHQAGKTHVEDLTEGLIPTVATIGWFHLFWLAVTIKAWFFPRYQFNQID